MLLYFSSFISSHAECHSYQKLGFYVKGWWLYVKAQWKDEWPTGLLLYKHNQYILTTLILVLAFSVTLYSFVHKRAIVLLLYFSSFISSHAECHSYQKLGFYVKGWWLYVKAQWKDEWPTGLLLYKHNQYILTTLILVLAFSVTLYSFVHKRAIVLLLYFSSFSCWASGIVTKN